MLASVSTWRKAGSRGPARALVRSFRVVKQRIIAQTAELHLAVSGCLEPKEQRQHSRRRERRYGRAWWRPSHQLVSPLAAAGSGRLTTYSAKKASKAAFKLWEGSAERMVKARAALETAEGLHAEMARAAPDLAGAEAALARARSVDEKARQAHLTEDGHQRVEGLMEKAGLLPDYQTLRRLFLLSRQRICCSNAANMMAQRILPAFRIMQSLSCVKITG